MSKKHRITLNPGGTVDVQLIDDLVPELYLLVVEQNLPRAERPVDPRTFGRATT